MVGISSTTNALSGDSNGSASRSNTDSANENSIASTSTGNLATAQTTAEALASKPSTADVLSGQNGDSGLGAPESSPFVGITDFGVASESSSATPLSATGPYGSALNNSLLSGTGTLFGGLSAPWSVKTDSAAELDASAGIEQLTDAYSSYQQDGDTAKFQQAASAVSVDARQQFVEQLAPDPTDQAAQGVNPQAHAINVVLRTLPEASFVASMQGLSSPQRDAVLADFVDVSVQPHSRRGTVTSYSPGGLIQKIGEVSDAETRAALFSQQLTQLDTQPQHATSAANAIINQLDAQSFELLSKPAIESLALSVADSSGGVIAHALSRLGGEAPSINHSLFARTLLSRLDSDALTVSQPRGPTENNDTLQSELASALAYKPGQTSAQTERASQVIQGLLSTPSGREFLAGDGISGPDRMFALEVATDHPELLTPDENVESADTPLWETSGISKLYASEAFARFHDRGDVSLSVSGGNIDNYLGTSLGLSPTSADNAEQMLAQGENVFENNDIIEPIADEIRDLQASVFDNQPVSLSTIPVLYTNASSGPVQLQIYRVEANGTTRFVDNVGRSYDSVQSWKDNNQLPAGQVTYAENLEAGGELVSEVTHRTVDTLGERILSIADTAALVGGVVASGVIIAASGGTATPLVAGAWVVAGGTAAYTGIRAGGELADRAEFGQTLNPMSDAGARAAWLSLGGSALTVGGGSLARLSTLAESGSTAATVAGRTGAVLNTGANYVDAAATADTAHGVISNWDQLSSSERAQGILETAFWGGMTGVSARASGGNVSDAFNLRIQVAQADIASNRAVIENPTLTDGAVSVVHSTDAAGNRTVQVQHAPDATPAEIDIHTNVARELASNQALNGGMYRTLTGEHSFMPGTRG